MFYVDIPRENKSNTCIKEEDNVVTYCVFDAGELIQLRTVDGNACDYIDIDYEELYEIKDWKVTNSDDFPVAVFMIKNKYSLIAEKDIVDDWLERNHEFGLDDFLPGLRLTPSDYLMLSELSEFQTIESKKIENVEEESEEDLFSEQEENLKDAIKRAKQLSKTRKP